MRTKKRTASWTMFAVCAALLLTGCTFLALPGISSGTTSGGTAEYTIVDTGQVDCYNSDGEAIACPSEGEALYGQDAQYEGAQFAFQDNGDGTVTDLNTGLMWQVTPSS